MEYVKRNGNNNGNGKKPDHHFEETPPSNGNGHKVLPSKDRFACLEAVKPRLFPPRQEVITRTGIRRNVLLLILFLVFSLYISSLPISSTVTDRNAVVVPLERTDLTSSKDGFMTESFVQEGERVVKNELLLRVSSFWEEKMIRENEFEILSLDKELSLAWAEAQVAALKLDEAIQLKKLGSVAEEALEEAILHDQASQNRVESLIFKLEGARVREHFLKKILLEGEIRAPFDGWVISNPKLKEKTFVKEGEFLIALASRQLQVEFLLREKDYSRVSVGSEAKIKFYAFPENIYEGRVVRVKPFAEAPARSGIGKHALKVLIQCAQAPENIQNGMTAKVAVEATPKSLLGRMDHELF